MKILNLKWYNKFMLVDWNSHNNSHWIHLFLSFCLVKYQAKVSLLTRNKRVRIRSFGKENILIFETNSTLFSLINDIPFPFPGRVKLLFITANRLITQLIRLCEANIRFLFCCSEIFLLCTAWKRQIRTIKTISDTD